MEELIATATLALQLWMVVLVVSFIGSIVTLIKVWRG